MSRKFRIVDVSFSLYAPDMEENELIEYLTTRLYTGWEFYGDTEKNWIRLTDIVVDSVGE